MPKITKEDYERAMKFLGDPRDSVSIDSKGNVTRTKWGEKTNAATAASPFLPRESGE